MPFVTKLALRGGDRRALDEVVADIKAAAERKGVELKGPHPKPPTELRVPQYARPGTDERRQFDPWRYTVYTRTMEIVGHDAFARSVAQREFPPGVHVAVEVEQVHPAGRGRG